MTSVIWVSEPLLHVLHQRLMAQKGATKPPVVTSSRELIEIAKTETTITFVDDQAIGELAQTAHLALPPGPIVALCNQPLPTAINLLQPYPWISHVISSTMLENPYCDELFENLIKTLSTTNQPRLLDWLGPTVSGRRIRLTHASRRVARLQRMTEFFEANNVQPRTLQLLRDAAEELLTNAFYDAPVAAGAIAKPVSRTEDVALPDDSACDLAYGCRDDLAIVRVRDPFGSLSRRRLVEVLTRCAGNNVQVDETMGGAGLGMWRIFSGASFVAVSVVNRRHTEILVGITKRAGAGPRPYAFHMFFRDTAHEKKRFWKLSEEESQRPSSVNKSVMIVSKSR